MSRSAVAIAVDVEIAFDARSVVVSDRMNDLFTIDVIAESREHDLDFDLVVGEPARVELRQGGRTHTYTGIVSECELLHAEPTGVSTYRFTVVPPVWLLTQRSNMRIYQYRSEVEVALLLLREWDVHPIVELDLEAYGRRKYRVQYGETDFRFLRRMLEEAGVSFWVREREGKSFLVVGDRPHLGEPRELTWVRDFTDDVLGAVALRSLSQIRPSTYVARDVDLRLKPDYPLYARHEGEGIEGTLETYELVPGFMQYVRDGVDDGTPTSDDRGAARSDEKRGAELAEVRAQEATALRDVVRFETNDLGVKVGDVVRIVGYRGGDVAGATERGVELLVAAVTITLGFEGKLAMSVLGVPRDRPFRPRRVTPKPRATGLESATVVGRQGDEIATDEHGRVRVAFHWDRESKHDDGSSCWLPVSQVWAGAGHGAMNLPRVGQEVLVDFETGDPDRPLVVGRVYTATSPVPYLLPGSSTESGWRSNSTNRKGGFNEIRMQDAGTRELFSIQAEKDMEIKVGHDMIETVGGSRHVWTDHADVEQIVGGRSITVNTRLDEEIGATDVAGAEGEVKIDGLSVYYDATEAMGTRAKKVKISGKFVNFVAKGILSVEVTGGTIYMVGAGATPPEGSDQAEIETFNEAQATAKNQGFILITGTVVDINPGAAVPGDAPVSEEQAQTDRDFEKEERARLDGMSDADLEKEMKSREGDFGTVPLADVPWYDAAWDFVLTPLGGAPDVQSTRDARREEIKRQVLARKIRDRETQLGRPVAPQVKNRYPNPKTSGRTTL